jgi:hypothetical protein
MGIYYENLDDKTREFMLKEIALDISNGKLTLSKVFNAVGKAVWADTLKEACQKYNDDWIASQLRAKRCMETYTTRTTKGKTIPVRVSDIAEETFAEGEFNRFYCRGVCARAIEEKMPQVEVYRGKAVQNPRPESQAKIGVKYDPNDLLNDLRTSQGVDTALGVPAGPNSGLTIRLVKSI